MFQILIQIHNNIELNLMNKKFKFTIGVIILVQKNQIY
jgi:hypothetical protein